MGCGGNDDRLPGDGAAGGRTGQDQGLLSVQERRDARDTVREGVDEWIRFQNVGVRHTGAPETGPRFREHFR